MLSDWIRKKDIMPCKYCGGDNYYSRFSDMEIKRYGIYCKNCNKYLGWAPDIDIKECIEIEKKENTLF